VKILSSDEAFSATLGYTCEQKGGSRNESEEPESLEERIDEAFAGPEQLTVIGKQLQKGDRAPDFRLDYLDLADLVIRTVGLADSAGMVRLLNVVNSLERPLCQHVTRQWEALCADLPSNACIYTVSRDSPQMQVDWQDRVVSCTNCSLLSTPGSSAMTMVCGSRNGVSCSEPSS